MAGKEHVITGDSEHPSPGLDFEFSHTVLSTATSVLAGEGCSCILRSIYFCVKNIRDVLTSHCKSQGEDGK